MTIAPKTKTTSAVTTAITAKSTHRVVVYDNIAAIITVNETLLGREVILTRVSATNQSAIQNQRRQFGLRALEK